MKTVPRRSLLKMLGAGAALLPFVPTLNASAEAVPPKRIIFLFTSCGTVYPAWKPTGTATDFTLGAILQPLAPFKDRLLVLDGLNYASGGAGTRHFQGPHRFLAGSKLLDGGSFEAVNGSTSGWGSHISVDQQIAKQVGAETPFASLEFGVNIDVTDPRSRMSFTASNKPVAPEDNPYKMFDRIFADAGLSPAELARLRLRRQSVIDTVRVQLDHIAQRSSAEDRTKLDAHLEGLRSIEKRLEMSGAACEPPVMGNPIDHHATANFQTVSRLQLDLMAAALGCDLTRVASLMWSRETSPQSFPWLGFNDKHHLLS
ncbi:MAG TPA: DUF1552 domain-containing protein, partial [Polyangiaceae bacterium]|nr:DUF1552 domain-containing protein [Polyangiaceae bacterium]